DPASDAPVRDVPLLSGACVFVRRSAIDATGGFDPKFFLYFEDYDWSVRFRSYVLRLLRGLRLERAARSRHALRLSARDARRPSWRWRREQGASPHRLGCGERGAALQQTQLWRGV